MAELATVARPYAQAAFALAREHNALPAWSSMLNLLAGVASDARVKEIIESPRLTADAKVKMVTDLCGDALSPLGQNFVRTVLGAGRAALLPAIAAQYAALKDVAENVAVAHVRTAMPLSAEQKAGFSAALHARYGKEIRIEEQHDDSLIAGAIIQVGDKVIDGSAVGRLQSMASAIKA